MKETKSELYLTIVLIIAATVALCLDKIPPEYWTAAIAALGGVYTVGRSIVKTNGK